MKSKIKIIMAAGILNILPITSAYGRSSEIIAANPYLPLWEHLPDGEPRVFEDPDNPGKFRVYITGSHDTQLKAYCGVDVHQWSAPVENLNDWRDEGAIFTYKSHGDKGDIFYAPDLVAVPRKEGGVWYYLFPHDLSRNRMVVRGERPDGPFEPVNVDDKGEVLPGGCFGFDPAVYVEAVTNPDDPDYNIGYRAWGYWGFQGSEACRLAPDMWQPYSNTSIISPFIPATKPDGTLFENQGTDFPALYPGENPADFGFFEASSIRKVGNKYVTVYSGRSGKEYGVDHSNSTLRYAYADTPLGPWRSGGVLVDSRGIVLSENGDYLECRNYGHNTHGSIEEINGQWYVFYHRPPRGFGFARQAMVAPISVESETKSVSDGGKVKIRAYDAYTGPGEVRAKNGCVYEGAEVTSEGFNIYGLPPYNYYSAGHACYISNGQSMRDNLDVWSNDQLVDMRDGDILGYKYFGFGGLGESKNGLTPFEGTSRGNNTKLNLVLTPAGSKQFTIEVWLDGPWDNDTWKGKKIGEITVNPTKDGQGEKVYTVDVADGVEGITGKHGIYLRCKGEGNTPLYTLRGMGFSKKDAKFRVPYVPEMKITVDGKKVDIPEYPELTTADNNFINNNHYYIKGDYKDGKTPIVAAGSSDNDVNIEMIKSTPEETIIEAVYNGMPKYFHIFPDGKE